MNASEDADAVLTHITIPQLVAHVYEEAPPSERCRLLEHLMRPLGVLSLAVIANGTFAKIWFRRGWHNLQVQPEDTDLVRSSDVISLVMHAQQVCMDVVDTLAQVLAASPVLAGSATAALLIVALLKRAQCRGGAAATANLLRHAPLMRGASTDRCLTQQARNACLTASGPSADTERLQLVNAHERPSIEDFIAGAYCAAYGARIARFMPQLVALYRGDELLAACGIRRAADEPLFLEAYLDVSVERRIEAVTGTEPRRGHILEAGNLAVARPGVARMLISLLTGYLFGSGEQWVVFTAVPLLRNNFRRLGIPLHVIGEARAQCLSVEMRKQWGRYYDCSPIVSAVRVADAAAALGFTR